MTRARYSFGLVAIALLMAGAILAQRGVDDARAATDGQILYLPNEKLLSHFTAGMDSIIADMLWLRCVQYTGEQLRGEHSFTWLQHMLETTVRLDPYFADVYRYGGMFLASLRADSDAGIDLLRQGIVVRPDAWELPYEMGMIYLLNRPDDPDARRRAAAAFAMAAARPGAPAFVREVVGALSEEYDIGALEEQMWANMLQSDDKLLRDLAQQKWLLAQLREAAAKMTEVAQAYARAKGRPPRTLQELVDAGGLSALPEDPMGGAFIIGPDATVHSTSVLDDIAQRRRTILRRNLDAYHEEHGAWPSSLGELVESTPLMGIPPHPYPNGEWHYDPATGEVK